MEEEKRTAQQNKAMWLFFTLLADKLNSSGLDMKKTLKQEIEIPWSKQTIHDFLWLPIQKLLLHKDSTTKLLKQEEIDKVFDTLNLHLGIKFGIHQEFPSLDRVMEEEDKKVNKFYNGN